jgi:hypothetical protein
MEKESNYSRNNPRKEWVYRYDNKWVYHRIDGPQDVYRERDYTIYYFVVNDKWICRFNVDSNTGKPYYTIHDEPLKIYLQEI